MSRRVGQQIYLDPAQFTELRALRDKGRGDVAALVREGVDFVLAFYAGAAALGGQALIDYRETVLARLRGGK